MSVIGFIAEHNLMTEVGDKAMTDDQKSSLTMYRNLTYAGPVIMGLGGIMVVAALVLTFEVRDTLGVKVAPTHAGGTSISSQPAVVVEGLPSDSGPGTRKSTIASISSTVASSITGAAVGASFMHQQQMLNSTRRLANEMSLPLTHINVPRDPNSTGVLSGLNFDRSRLHETIQETTLSSDADELFGAVGGFGSNHSNARTPLVEGGQFVVAPMQQNSTMSSSSHNNRQVSALDALTFACKKKSGQSSQMMLHLPSSKQLKYTDDHDDDTPTAVTASSSIFAVVAADSSLNALPDNDSNPGFFRDDDSGHHRGFHRYRRSSSHDMFATSSSSGTSQSDQNLCLLDSQRFYIDANGCLFGFQSPQDVELSDPEGCSLVAPERWRSSGKCSCSGSPTLDSTLDVFFTTKKVCDDKDSDYDPYLKDQLFEQQLLQQKLLQQQQFLLQQQQHQLQLQQRLLLEQKCNKSQPCRPKTIASIESDGLSSTSGSSVGDIMRDGSAFINYSSFIQDMAQQSRKQRYQQTQERVISTASSTTSASTVTQVTQKPKSVHPSSQASSSSSPPESSISKSSRKNSNNDHKTHLTSVKVHREEEKDKQKKTFSDSNVNSPIVNDSETLLLESSPLHQRTSIRRKNLSSRSRSRSKSKDKTSSSTTTLKNIGSNSNHCVNTTDDCSGDNSNTPCHNNNNAKSKHGNDNRSSVRNQEDSSTTTTANSQQEVYLQESTIQRSVDTRIDLSKRTGNPSTDHSTLGINASSPPAASALKS
jgi:hypothetical protein